MKSLAQNPLDAKQNELFKLSRFVVLENFKHHADNVLPSTIQEEIDSIYQEELAYAKNAIVFMSKTRTGKVQGTIRSMRWDYRTPLPIQKMFGIDPTHYVCGLPQAEIWHIGRFAIKKGTRDIMLLKELMANAIEPVCQHPYNVAFAECDAKLLRIMRLMGIKAEVIGESIDYLGSETIPVLLPYEGLIEFYHQNKHLVSRSDAAVDFEATSLENKAVA